MRNPLHFSSALLVKKASRDLYAKVASAESLTEEDIQNIIKNISQYPELKQQIEQALSSNTFGMVSSLETAAPFLYSMGQGKDLDSLMQQLGNYAGPEVASQINSIATKAVTPQDAAAPPPVATTPPPAAPTLPEEDTNQILASPNATTITFSESAKQISNQPLPAPPIIDIPAPAPKLQITPPRRAAKSITPEQSAAMSESFSRDIRPWENPRSKYDPSWTAEQRAQYIRAKYPSNAAAAQRTGIVYDPAGGQYLPQGVNRFSGYTYNKPSAAAAPAQNTAVIAPTLQQNSPAQQAAMRANWQASPGYKAQQQMASNTKALEQMPLEQRKRLLSTDDENRTGFTSIPL